jgi:hypothetical protein
MVLLIQTFDVGCSGKRRDVNSIFIAAKGAKTMPLYKVTVLMFKPRFVKCRGWLFLKLQSKKTKILTLDYVKILVYFF